jgi:transposase InsO family protein
VKTMCRVRCSVIRGYYAWCKREPSLRQLENERRTEHIRRASKMGRQLYGSPRMHAEMRAQGSVAASTVWCAVQKRHCMWTADSHHSDPVAPHLSQRDFTAPAPNQKWLTDRTDVWTVEGWLYLAIVLGVSSRLERLLGSGNR